MMPGRCKNCIRSKLTCIVCCLLIVLGLGLQLISLRSIPDVTCIDLFAQFIMSAAPQPSQLFVNLSLHVEIFLHAQSGVISHIHFCIILQESS